MRRHGHERVADLLDFDFVDRHVGPVGLRVGIKKVGCSGFAYTFDYADDVGANDALYESHGAKLVVDREALPYLDGSTLDFVRQGLKELFRFDNPNVKNECGCGESFNV